MDQVKYKQLLNDMQKAAGAIVRADDAIQIFGGHGDTEAMREIFKRIRRVHDELDTFIKRHGEEL